MLGDLGVKISALPSGSAITSYRVLYCTYYTTLCPRDLCSKCGTALITCRSRTCITMPSIEPLGGLHNIECYIVVYQNTKDYRYTPLTASKCTMGFNCTLSQWLSVYFVACTKSLLCVCWITCVVSNCLCSVTLDLFLITLFQITSHLPYYPIYSMNIIVALHRIASKDQVIQKVRNKIEKMKQKVDCAVDNLHKCVCGGGEILSRIFTQMVPYDRVISVCSALCFLIRLWDCLCLCRCESLHPHISSLLNAHFLGTMQAMNYISSPITSCSHIFPSTDNTVAYLRLAALQWGKPSLSSGSLQFDRFQIVRQFVMEHSIVNNR